MLPKDFSAFTLVALSRAAEGMTVEVRIQFATIVWLGEEISVVKMEYINCIYLSTRYSTAEMVLPGAHAIVTPLIVGFGFGEKSVVTLLLSAIV